MLNIVKTDMRRRTYKNPPIAEALCEFHFVNNTEWDPMFLLEFRRKIESSYPGTPKKQTSVETNIHAQGSKMGTTFFLDQGLERIQFSDESRKHLVSIGQNVISVHVLRPYQSWEKFRVRIENALNNYCSTVPCDGIKRIGLRYINSIEIDHEGDTDLNQYFSVPPTPPPGVSASISRFFDRTELIYDDEPIKLVVFFADTDSIIGRPTFLLDLDLIWDFGENSIDVNHAMEKVEILRDRERDVFESMITNKLRESFDAKQE